MNVENLRAPAAHDSASLRAGGATDKAIHAFHIAADVTYTNSRAIRAHLAVRRTMFIYGQSIQLTHRIDPTMPNYRLRKSFATCRENDPEHAAQVVAMCSLASAAAVQPEIAAKSRRFARLSSRLSSRLPALGSTC